MIVPTARRGAASHAPSAFARFSDDSLLLRFRDLHEEEAFAELVSRYQRPLYVYLVQHLHNPELAEELVQATFCRLWEKCNQYLPGREVRPWLYSIATHVAADVLRRELRRPHLSLDEERPDAGHAEDGTQMHPLYEMTASDAPDPEREAEAHEWRDWARRALKQLPLPLQVALQLVFFEQLTYKQAALQLHVAEGTVKWRVHAAIAALRAIWVQEHAARPEG